MMFTPSPLKEPDTRTIAACTCGRVGVEASGPPIISVVCHCDDCQEGANRIEALPGAARILTQQGVVPSWPIGRTASPAPEAQRF